MHKKYKSDEVLNQNNNGPRVHVHDAGFIAQGLFNSSKKWRDRRLDVPPFVVRAFVGMSLSIL